MVVEDLDASVFMDLEAPGAEGRRRPGEVMDVLCMQLPDHVAGNRRILGDVFQGLEVGLGARMRQQQGVGHGQLHVVDPEVRKEFRVGMVGMTVPLVVLIDPHLREPLSPHEEPGLLGGGAAPAAAGNDSREAALPGHLQLDRFPGRHKARQTQPVDGLVFAIVSLEGLVFQAHAPQHRVSPGVCFRCQAPGHVG